MTQFEMRLIHMRDMIQRLTHSCPYHGSVRDSMYSYAWHDLTRDSGRTHLMSVTILLFSSWVVSFMCVTWISSWRDLFICVTCLSLWRDSYAWDYSFCDATHPYAWHDSGWLIHVRDMSYLWRGSGLGFREGWPACRPRLTKWWCSVVECVAVCCSVLQCVASACRSAKQLVRRCESTL